MGGLPAGCHGRLARPCPRRWASLPAHVAKDTRTPGTRWGKGGQAAHGTHRCGVNGSLRLPCASAARSSRTGYGAGPDTNLPGDPHALYPRATHADTPVPTQLARTQPPCERRRDGCPGPGFTPGQPAARCGSFLGGSLKRGPNRASAQGSPHRHSTAPRDAGVHSPKRQRAVQREFVGQVWIFLGGTFGAERREERIRHPYLRPHRERQ